MRNTALNSLVNVYCWNAAVGQAPGELLVPVLDYGREFNFGGLSLEGRAEGERVPVVTIDGLNLPQCSLIKIDVEGMEKSVLEGAAATIARCQPLLYVENDRREKAAALMQAVSDLGYNMYWHLPPYFNPGNFAGNRNNVFGNIVSINMLCCPKGMPQRVAGLQRVEWPPPSQGAPPAPPASAGPDAENNLVLPWRCEAAGTRPSPISAGRFSSGPTSPKPSTTWATRCGSWAVGRKRSRACNRPSG